MDAIRFEATIGQGGMLTVPDVQEGDRVEVIVLKLNSLKKPVRKGGWIKGQIVIKPGFEDSILAVEDDMNT